MRIIVCVKHVPNTLKYDFENNSIKRENIDSTINPYDLYAIETALRLKDKYGGEVFSLCMGVSGAKQTLIKTIALGVDSAYLLCDKIFAGADTFATSYVLAEGIKKINNYDIIICGRQSSDGDTGQVGVEIAEKLDIPYITNVTNVDIQNTNIYCDYISDERKLKVCCKTPCLITIEKGCCETRIPTIKNLIRSANQNIAKWSSQELNVDIKFCGLSGSYTRVKNTYIQKREIKNTVQIIGSIDKQVNCVKKMLDETIGEKYE